MMAESADVIDLSPELTGLSIEQTNQLLSVYKNILQAIVTNHDYQFTLDTLCQGAENIIEDSQASIMLFDIEGKALSVRSGPSMSDDMIKHLNGLKPGKNAGSCGTAVFTGKPQFVYDTSNDLRWHDFNGYAESFNIKSCWSMPIVNSSNAVIGAFALSSFECRAPNHFQEMLLQTASYLASIILARESEENELNREAHFDYLTGLPNRSYFTHRAEQAIAHSKRGEGDLALFFIDLDNFKPINDQHGHDIGDRVLKIFAERLTDSLRQEDTIARIGGDEFIVLLEGISHRSELDIMAEKLLKLARFPMEIDQRHLWVSASIGICVYTKEISDASSLIKQADWAMYQAKASGKNSYQIH